MMLVTSEKKERKGKERKADERGSENSFSLLGTKENDVRKKRGGEGGEH